MVGIATSDFIHLILYSNVYVQYMYVYTQTLYTHKFSNNNPCALKLVFLNS